MAVSYTHLKHAVHDKLDVLKKYEYTVALPAPALYSQFNNLDDVNIVLNALLLMGFNDVFEVSAAAEMVSEATREYISSHEEKLPLISTACPSIVRLIRVRFPNLIPHMPVSYTHLLDSRSCTVFFLDSSTLGVLVQTSIPSFTGYTQEATKERAPFTSTTQTRHAPISLISFKKHRVGISMLASLAASRMVEPFGAVTSMPLILSVTFSICSFLPYFL